MSDNRITKPILLNNEKYMSEVTIFHWLSHKAIAGYEIISDYERNEEMDFTKESYLCQNAIKEKITLRIYLNCKHNITAYFKKNCTKVIFEKEIDECSGFKLNISDGKNKCENRNCSFLCKWMATKNYYLYKELFSLSNYLNRVNNNVFATSIDIEYIYSKNAKFLASNEYELIKNYIK